MCGGQSTNTQTQALKSNTLPRKVTPPKAVEPTPSKAIKSIKKSSTPTLSASKQKQGIVLPIPTLTRQDVYYYKPLWNHYHYNTYYPFYPFYWYFADYFYNYYPFYYTYYIHYHPSIIQSFRGPLIFEDQTIDPSINGITVFDEMKEKSLSLKSCQNGPQYKFTANTVNGRQYRVFIGDVNDFFNIECIYLMNGIISIGDFDYSNHLLKMYAHPSRSVSLIDYKDVVKVDPFQNSLYRPYEPQVKHVTKTVRNLNFKIGIDELTFTDKNLVFFHSNDEKLKKVSNAIEEISQYVESGNILFILDNFNKATVRVYRSLVRHYSGVPAHRHIVYRNVRYHQ
jgi:hypothetical protein